MQTQYGTAAEAAILAVERVFRNSLKVDWNNNGKFDHALSDLSEFAESVGVERSLSGSAPAEILLIEGSSAAELTIVMSGEYLNQSLTAVFSPYNTSSPLYGKSLVGQEIVWEIGVEASTGFLPYPQFVGNVRTVTPNRAENTVTITALDRVEKLRKPVQLAPWAVSDEHINYGEVDSQLCYSHWVIDNCLRLCDVGPTPKRPAFREELGVPPDGLDGVQLYVTGNGSWIPTIGYADNPNADTFPSAANAPMYRQNAVKHPDAPTDAPAQLGFGGLSLPIQQRYATPGDKGIIRYWSVNQDLINPSATHYLGFTLNTSDVQGQAFTTIGGHTALEVYIGMGRILRVNIAAGQVWSDRISVSAGVSSTISTTRVNIPTGQPSVDIWVQWDNTSQSGSRALVRAGSNTSGWVSIGSPVTSGSDDGTDQIKGRVTIGQALHMSDIVYAVRNIFGASADGFSNAFREPKYAAAVDMGLNRFSHMPSTQAEEAWKIITDVAGAEFGSVFWDENGVFRFWNMNTVLAKQDTVVRTLSLDDVSDLQLTSSLDSVRNIYSVQTAKKRAVYKGKVYASNDVNEFYVEGQTTKHFRLFRGDVMSPLTFFMTKHTSFKPAGVDWPLWTDDVPHGYAVQYLFDGLWQEMNHRVGVDIRVYFTSLNELNVSIYNGWTEPIRLATGSGTDSQPAFCFTGTQIFEGDTLSVMKSDTSSIAKYGPQNLELSGDWYQDTFGAYDMVSMLLDRTKEPIPATDSVRIAGDPRLQLGDTISISDPDGFGHGIRYQIYGINRTLSRADGLVDDLTIETVGPPAA